MKKPRRLNVFPIAWHEDCAKNMRDTYERMMANAVKLLYEAESGMKHVVFYEHQISEAKTEGREGFDRDKYKKVKK